MSNRFWLKQVCKGRATVIDHGVPDEVFPGYTPERFPELPIMRGKQYRLSCRRRSPSRDGSESARSSRMTAWFRVSTDPVLLLPALPRSTTVENRGGRAVGLLVGEMHTILPGGEFVLLARSDLPLFAAADTDWTTLRVSDDAG